MSTLLTQPPTTRTTPRTSGVETADKCTSAKQGGRTPAKQGGLTIADQAVVSLTSFIAAAIVGHVGKEELGLYTLGISTLWLTIGIPNALVWTPYTSRAPRMREEKRQRYASSCTRMAFGMGVAMALVALVGGLIALAVSQESRWLAYLLLAMAPLSLTMTLREHIRRVACADFQAKRMLLLDLPVCGLQLAGVLVLWWLDRLNALSALIVVGAAAAISMPLAIGMAARAKVSMRRVLREVSSNWRFGRWLLIVAVAWLLSEGALRWLLTGMHGAAAIGQFGAVLAIVMLVNPLMLAMTAFARSWAARVFVDGRVSGLLRHTQRSTVVGLLIAGAVLMFLHVTGDFFVTKIFGDQYSDPVLLTIVAAGICLQAAVIPIEAALTATEQGKELSLVAAAGLITTLVLGVPLVYMLGPLGVAWTMVARNLTALLFSGWLLWGSPAHSPLVAPRTT